MHRKSLNITSSEEKEEINASDFKPAPVFGN